MTTLDEGRAALERLRNPTPRDRVQNYLSHAIHLYRCGPNPGHGPYKHEDEAGYYADVALKVALAIPDEQSGVDR